MKKFFFVFFLFPFFSLAGDFVTSKIYRFQSSDGSSPTQTQSVVYTNDFVSVQLYMSGQLHAVPYSSSIDSLSYSSALSASSSQAWNRPILDLDSGLYVPFPQLTTLYFLDLLAARLVYSGFTIPQSSYNPNTSSIYVHSTNSSGTVFYNLRSLNIVNSALVSTNTVWRSFVVNSLSSLSSDVRQMLLNSSTGLGTLTNLGSALESLSVNFGRVNSFSLNVATNFSNAVQDWAMGLDTLSYGWDEIVDQVELANSQGIGLDYFSAVRGGYGSLISDAYKAYFSKVAEDPDYVGLGNLRRLIDNPSQVQAVLSSSYNTPLTNEMRRMSADWKEATTNALAQNTASITNQLQEWKRQSGLLHDDTSNRLERIGTTLGDVKDYSKNVSDLLSGNTPNKAHVIVDNEAVPVNVMNWPSTLELKFTANDLDVLVNANAATSKELLDNLTNRIDSITNAVSGLPDYLASLSNLIFQLDFDVTNTIGEIDFPSNVFSSSFSALLLDDYSNFVENAWFDFSNNLEENFPDLYAGLSSFGFDSSDRYGRWWSYASSSLGLISSCCQSNTFFLARLMADIAELDTVFDDHFGSDVFSKTRRILSSFPTETQINDYIDQCTNSTAAVSGAFDRFNVSLFSLSNSYDSVFAPFKGQYTSVPPSLTIMKTANEKYFSIPVGDQPRVWLFLRYGISFGLVAVNLLLLPKYLLMLFTIFSRVVLHGHRILPGDR